MVQTNSRSNLTLKSFSKEVCTALDEIICPPPLTEFSGSAHGHKLAYLFHECVFEHRCVIYPVVTLHFAAIGGGVGRCIVMAVVVQVTSVIWVVT